jgi:hypothetical protein
MRNRSKNRAVTAGIDVKLAAKWACDERTIRRWRKDGAPLGRPAAMRVWLACRKNLPPGTAGLLTEHRRVTTAKDLAGDGGLDKGAASALRRLEIMEAKTYRALERAMERGDAIEVKATRESWLRVSESLRRYDLAIEANRRGVDLVPKKLVVDAARKCAAGLRFAHRGFESCAQLVVGLNDPAAVWSVLAKPADEFMPAALASLEHSGCPEWLLTAFAEGAQAFPGDTAHSRELAETIRALVAGYGAQARELYDLRTATEAKWRSCTDPETRARIWHEELNPLLGGKIPEALAGQLPAPSEQRTGRAA